MRKSRITQVTNLLETLNRINLEDYEDEYAKFSTSETRIYVEAKNKTARIAIEQLLESFQKMAVYVITNTKLEILFWE